jgi:hypothetical protein
LQKTKDSCKIEKALNGLSRSEMVKNIKYKKVEMDSVLEELGTERV